jgi:hypothetical protein
VGLPDRTEVRRNEPGDYEILAATVAKEMGSKGTVSKETFLGVWNWKGAMRVIRHMRIEDYDTLYAPGFRPVASEPPHRKLAVLLDPGFKLPGVEAPTGSTIIHFIHPHSMPILDVRTIGVLFAARLPSTRQKEPRALRRISAGR